MASKGTLVFATMLLCALCSMSIREEYLLPNPVLKNNLKLGSIGDPPANNLPGNSSRGSSIKAAQTRYSHFAGYHSKGADRGQPWHGVRARITVWEIPDVGSLSTSGAYIAAINEVTGLEAISAGVHVNPLLYNDNKLHFFTHWTSAIENSSGCYNDHCPGFVIANYSNLLPGQPIAPPFSTYGGEQSSITIRIKRDEHTGDWSLYREDIGGPIGGMTLLGWWPWSLFRSLNVHADTILWTGFAIHNSTEASPSMGSGHFSSELDGRSASFEDCVGFDEYGNIYEEYYNPSRVEDKPSYYTITPWYDTKHAARRHFFYGGPGGCCE